MPKRKYITLLVITVLSVLVACSSEKESQSEEQKNENSQKIANQGTNVQEDNEEENNTQQTEISAPKVPKTMQEIVESPPGELSHLKALVDDRNKNKAVKYFKENLPKLKDNVSEDKLDAYWRKSHALFHKSYPSKDKILKLLKYSSFGNPKIEDERFQFKENLNIEILLDASGSMAGQVDGKPKMTIAKETINSFANSLPEGANIGLRVYGHKGTGSDNDKKLSCNSSELVYQLQSYNEGKYNEALNKFSPAGWTPIALALKEAQKDLSKYPAENNTNIIYLVSDGIATCNGDPVQAAKKLGDSNINPIVNVIGFDIDNEGQRQLKDISESVEGIYSNAQNQDELNKQLDRSKEIAEAWEQWKVLSNYKAENEYFKNNFDILYFILEWENNKFDEQDNMTATWLALRDEGYLSNEAYQYLDEKAEEQRGLVNDIHEQMKDQLEQLNTKNYEDTKKFIEEKYEQKGE